MSYSSKQLTLSCGWYRQILLEPQKSETTREAFCKSR